MKKNLAGCSKSTSAIELNPAVSQGGRKRAAMTGNYDNYKWQGLHEGTELASEARCKGAQGAGSCVPHCTPSIEGREEAVCWAWGKGSDGGKLPAHPLQALPHAGQGMLMRTLVQPLLQSRWKKWGVHSPLPRCSVKALSDLFLTLPCCVEKDTQHCRKKKEREKKRKKELIKENKILFLWLLEMMT